MELFKKFTGFAAVLGAVATFGSAQTASAGTLATFDVTGDFVYTAPATTPYGSTFSMDGTFSGDASKAGDPTLVQQLAFSASLDASVYAGAPGATTPVELFSGTVFSGTTDPLVGSLEEVALVGLLLLDVLDTVTAGVSTDVLTYMAGNTGTLFTISPGYDMTFTYTGGVAGAGLSGTYDLDIFSAAGLPTLDVLVNGFLFSEGLTPIVPSSSFYGGFDASFAISAVPLPATLPMLGFGAAGLIAVARRKKKIA